MDRFFTPETPGASHFCHRANSSPAKGMMEQVLPIKGETRPVKKILPGLPGFIPSTRLSFVFPVLSRTALALLQPAPCRPCQGLQSNHEGSAQVGYKTTETGSTTPKALLRHLIALGKSSFSPNRKGFTHQGWNNQMCSLCRGATGFLLLSSANPQSEVPMPLVSAPNLEASCLSTTAIQQDCCSGTRMRSGAPEKYPSNPWPTLAAAWPQHERMEQG